MMKKSFNWEKSIHYGQALTLPKSSLLFRQGDRGIGFYYLKDGEIKVSLVNYNGDERIIDYVSPGELIGEHGIHDRPYFTTAETIKDSTLYYFSPQDFQQLCTNVPEAAEELNLSLANKIRMLVDIKSILNAPIEVQIAYLFYRFYKKTGNTEIPLSQTTISNFVGTSRVSVWKVLREWKDEKIISNDNRVIYLLEIQKIKEKFIHFIHSSQYRS